MAELAKVKMGENTIEVTLNMSKSDYELIKQSEKDLIVLPANPELFEHELTTGTIGNGNRLMLPNKFLSKHEVEVLHKKLPSTIITIDGTKYLICKLEEKKPGIPVYKEE